MKASLLIVDDNDQMRQLIRGLVADLAEQLYEGRDGSEAVVLYAAHQPDWVLMDIKMEGMDGLTATRRILASFPEAKIVILTNYNDAKTRQTARQAGACEFLAKDNLLEVRRILVAGRHKLDGAGP